MNRNQRGRSNDIVKKTDDVQPGCSTSTPALLLTCQHRQCCRKPLKRKLIFDRVASLGVGGVAITISPCVCVCDLFFLTFLFLFYREYSIRMTSLYTAQTCISSSSSSNHVD